jgi:hypothetical protein
MSPVRLKTLALGPVGLGRDVDTAVELGGAPEAVAAPDDGDGLDPQPAMTSRSTVAAATP